MDTIHPTDAVFAWSAVLVFLGIIGATVAVIWIAYKNRQIQQFRNDELEMMPWNAAVKAFNSGKPTPALFLDAQHKAAAMIGNGVLAQVYNAEQLAEVQHATALSYMNDNIAADPLALAVYRRMDELCRQARTALSPFGVSIASMRERLQQQVDAVIIEETRRFAAPICQAEVDEFRNMSADDPRFNEAFNRWLNGA